ncbi:MAG: hypothetical protein Q7S74_06200 [Nanoarchaeota archaeon]|nr:hypothetical protein [Nanoarchaeota archaeon]
MNTIVTIIELLSLLIAVVLYFIMQKIGYKKVWKKYLFMILAILLFMIMSEPMYRNPGLDSWAYIYRDVPWTVVLGWADIFFASIIITDKLWPKRSEKVKFWLYLIIVTIITVPIESVLLSTGLRTYVTDLTKTFSGILIPLTNVPIEVLVAVPIIATLIISFYKFLGED